MKNKNIYIGLKYSPNVDNAPRVLFKFCSYQSDKIITMLKKENIPLIRDRILVSLLEQIPTGSEVPEELYIVIANIYRILYKNGYIKKENH
jgi:flagellar biosynthesis protein